jgi:hypothetical protein
VSSAADFVRRRWVLLGAFVLTVGVVVWSSREPPVPIGGDIDLTFTLIPPDARGLSCSSAQPLEGERCAFDGAGAPVKVERPLRPYTTTSREIILLTGVFEDPSVQKWLEQATEKRDDTRVMVRCHGTFLGRAPQVKVRWGAEGSFEAMDDIRMGRMKTCRVGP